MNNEKSAKMRAKLVRLYGVERGTAAFVRLQNLLDDFRAQHPANAQNRDRTASPVTERDVMLITYGDSLRAVGAVPLQTLTHFLQDKLRGVISAVHVLPFYPYSSDDGFSVIDYQAIDSDLGSWDDVRVLGAGFDLMFDAVINHISAQSEWFQRFLAGDPVYKNFFIAVDPATDLSGVVRPRSLPLLTAFDTASGTQHIWTTFSADQVDLNFAEEDVLLRIVEVLLFYIEQGMRFIRLDAIAYLWKVIGTSCIHLEETHLVVKLFRDIFDAVAPEAIIITETNVPHAENVSYFGNGVDEAQLVYQFTLPPLTLHTFATGDATVLSEWAAGLETVSDQVTFFNFTASHDGIGVRPVEGILDSEQVGALVTRARAHGGDVSFKRNSDGSESPYELNINYFDALSNPRSDEPLVIQVRRFIASQAIQIAFMGMPGIYIHSLLGSRNWPEGVRQTERLRSINREKLNVAEVRAALEDPESVRSQVFSAYKQLIVIRTGEKAFHPNGPQQVLRLHPACFALLRTSPDGSEQIVALHNVAKDTLALDLKRTGLSGVQRFRDLISGAVVEVDAQVELAPYQVMWLKVE